MSYHPTMFHDHRQCSGGDVMVLVCNVISKDYVIKAPYDFMDRSTAG